MRITIPRNDAQAREVAEQHYLSGWALAGYVASQVRIGEHGGDRKSIKTKSSLDRISTAEFAAKGFRGLRSKDTVRLYAERWLNQFGAPPRPGQVVVIPDGLDWPPDDQHRRLDNGDRRAAVEAQAEADGTSKASAIRVAESPQAMAAAIKADPVAQAAAAAALVSSPEGIAALRKAGGEASKARISAEDPTFPERHAKVLRDMEMDGADAQRAIDRITRQQHLDIVDLWLMEWAKAGDSEAIDHVGLRLDEVRGVIAEQANALTPEMFTEGSDR